MRPFQEVRMRATLAASAFTVALLGCAHSRLAEVRSRAAEHVYEAPVESLWPKVRGVLESDGFRIREDASHWALETEWKEDFGGSNVAGVWTRYFVVADPLG